MNALGEFGQRIRALRTEKGLTQQQLADKVFITRAIVSNWEAGTRMPDIVMISRLSRILDVKPYELIGDASDADTSPTLIVVEDEPCLLTGHSEYSFDALRLHCSGYILKPLTPEKIRNEMAHLRFPIQGGINA